MPVLFRRDVPVRSLFAITPEQARALASPIRVAMLELLGTRPMSIDELAADLPAHGFKQAPNTLRHHLELLRNAGLVEQAMLEQTRGAVLQYYAATSRPLHQRFSEDGEAELDALAERLRPALTAAVRSVERTDPARIRRLVRHLEECPRCASDGRRDLVLLAALHRASVQALRQVARQNGHGPARSGTARRPRPTRR